MNESFTTINPTTEASLKTYVPLSASEIDLKLKESVGSFKGWSELSIKHRISFVQKLSKILLQSKEDFAKIMALEMGKPLSQGIAEITKCSLVCDYYSENGEKFLQDEIVKTDYYKSFISYQPLGPVLGIMPWNFPFWQFYRFAIPSLIAGNAILLKHSPNTLGCAEAIEKTFRDARLPAGVFQNLISTIENTKKIITDSRLQGVSLTGSVRAGKQVAALAGSALKKAVFELGGSDAYIVLEDADFDNAVEKCLSSRLINSGQTCVAAKRFIVVEPLRKKFEEAFVEKMKAVKFGDPFDSDSQIGPLARDDLREHLHQQVQGALQDGAKLAIGGQKPNSKGYFYEPTVLIDLKPEMKIAQDETFGPVASILGAKDEAEALQIANSTSYGLGAAIFTQDLDRAERIAKTKVFAGSVFVNDFVKSDPRLPFGGIKDSGYGRELGIHGIHEFTNAKTLCIA